MSLINIPKIMQLSKMIDLCTKWTNLLPFRPIPITTDRIAWSVGLSVGLSATLVSLAKTAEAIEMPFALRTRVGP